MTKKELRQERFSMGGLKFHASDIRQRIPLWQKSTRPRKAKYSRAFPSSLLLSWVELFCFDPLPMRAPRTQLNPWAATIVLQVGIQPTLRVRTLNSRNSERYHRVSITPSQVGVNQDVITLLPAEREGSSTPENAHKRISTDHPLPLPFSLAIWTIRWELML